MASQQVKAYTRTLIAFVIIVAAAFGGVAAGSKWSDATWTPKLALDLAGGTQIILEPQVSEADADQVTDQTINEAIEIMRQRVDSSGVSEAQISSQGGRNIVVELPGDPEEQRETRDLVKQSAKMDFRPVLNIGGPEPLEAPTLEPAPGQEAPAPGQEAPAPGQEAPAPGQEAPAPGQEAPVEGGEAPAPEEEAPAEDSDNGVWPATDATPEGEGEEAPAEEAPAEEAPAEEAPEDATEEAPAEEAPAEENPADLVPAPASPAGPTTGEPQNPSDPAWITEEIAAEFAELDCTKPESLITEEPSDPTKPLVACDALGTFKAILGPVEVNGADVKDAYADLERNAQGQPTNRWAVYTEFEGDGVDDLQTMTERLFNAQAPFNQFAVVLDDRILSAPRANGIITGGSSVTTGNFTQESATVLANQLKFGALPMSFEVQTENQISALLGSEQLEKGLLAGVIGLLLVVVYSLVQYRALGLVTVASLLIAAGLTYASICLLAWYQGYRLSLAGVTGLIVAIGITADSFIVYFERIRDELRDGRPLASAVESAWGRARRTIIISDLMNFLAAAVLYVLAVGGVRGFAFTLGLTTLIDLIIVLLFTHPVIGLLARSEFFASGHKMSGLSEASLTHEPIYAGRGRVRVAERTTLAAKRAAAASDEPGSSAAAGVDAEPNKETDR